MIPVTFLVILVTFNLGPLSTLARPNNIDKMPEKCQEKSYCFEKLPNYPQEAIEKLLNETKQDLWFEAELKGYESRVGTQDNDCKVEHHIGHIYEIIDEEGMLRYVVQSDNRFKQSMQIEECVKPGRLMAKYTLHFKDSDLTNHLLTCEQKYIHFNFLVLTPDFKGVELAKAKGGIPVCCACVYHRS